MRKPEEIKKGLECCILETDDTSTVDYCRACPYQPTGLCFRTLLKDVTAYINQFENHFREVAKKVQQLERERDAAVRDVKELGDCKGCKHDDRCHEVFIHCEDCIDLECPCRTCEQSTRNNWQWRGVEANQ